MVYRLCLKWKRERFDDDETDNYDMITPTIFGANPTHFALRFVCWLAIFVFSLSVVSDLHFCCFSQCLGR